MYEKIFIEFDICSTSDWNINNFGQYKNEFLELLSGGAINDKDIEKFNSNLRVKLRSTGNMIKAEIKVKKDIAEIILEKKELGISPGQACVFYVKNQFGDKVLGGGWISNS